jgi:DNA-binding MarR family transcriptional regulator
MIILDRLKYYRDGYITSYQLAKVLNMSHKTVSRHLNEMEVNGLVERLSVRSSDGRHAWRASQDED